MLNPKPSEVPESKRERYVLETAKKLADGWNFLPPQPEEHNKERIIELLRKRDEYLRTNLELIWTTSPKSLRSSLESSLRSSFWSSPESSLWSSLGSSLRLSLKLSLGSSLRSSLESSLGSSLGSSLESSLKSSLWSSLGSSIWSSFWSSPESSLRSWNDFLFWGNLYQFNENSEIKNFIQYLPEAYKNGLGFAVINDKEFYALAIPKYHLNRENQLHGDLEPAVIWEDGDEEYWLNGVKCPKYLVMTPWNKLESRELVKERNADVRREFVRKAGIEKICRDLRAEVIDEETKIKGGPYQLLALNIGDGEKRPYLRMIHPGIGTYHIEGVLPEIRTVKQALAWRYDMPDYKEPEVVA